MAYESKLKPVVQSLTAFPNRLANRTSLLQVIGKSLPKWKLVLLLLIVIKWKCLEFDWHFSWIKLQCPSADREVAKNMARSKHNSINHLLSLPVPYQVLFQVKKKKLNASLGAFRQSSNIFILWTESLLHIVDYRKKW